MPVSVRSLTLPLPTGGLQRDRNQRFVDDNALYDVKNWMVVDGRFRVRYGWDQIYSSLAKYPLGIIQYDHSSEPRRIVVGHEDGWACLLKSGGTWTDITDPAKPLTGGASNQQVFRIFPKGGVSYVIGCNGVDAPKKWDGDMTTPSDYADFAGSPNIAKCMAISANRVLLGNLTVLGVDAVQCSAQNDFDSGWATISVRLADTPGEITAMMELGNLQCAIYKEDAIYVAIAQSTAVPFRFELRKAGIAGPVSPLSVVPLPDGSHAYFAQDASIMVFDGVSVAPLGGQERWRMIQRAIVENFNPNFRARVWGAYDQEQGMLWFVYPSAFNDLLGQAIVIDLPGLVVWKVEWNGLRMSAGTHLFGTVDVTFSELTAAISTYTNTIGEWSIEAPTLMFMGTTGQLYLQQGNTDAGSAIAASFESGLKDLGNAETSKTVIEMNHLFKGPAGAQAISVEVGASDYGEAPVYQAPVSIDINTNEPHVTGHRYTGRMVCERISLSTSQEIELSGIGMTVIERGQR